MVSLQAALVGMILSSGGPTVLLDFYGDNCPPCRAMAPTIDELSAKYPIRKINAAVEAELVAQYGVTQIPCFIMLRDGEEVDRVIGGTTYSRIEQMCKLGQGLVRKGQSPLEAYLAPANQLPKTPPSNPLPMAASPRPVERGFTAPPRQVAVVEPPPRVPPRVPSQMATLQAIPASHTTPAASQPPATAGSDWRLSQPGWTPRGNARATRDAGMISASVRLRIEDPRGHSCGSGTIIHTHRGLALVLTCGHIFRDSQGKGKIEIDLFGPDSSQRVPGRLVSYDEKADVGLVAFDVPGPVKTARVAPREYRIGAGDSVVTVGCNNGDRPSTRHTRITAVDRCVGPPNFQIAGRSVEGRSGGGLFSGEGMVIGVCNAAYQNEDESLYAALGAVHAELDKVGLSCVYRSPNTNAPLPAARASDTLVAISPPTMPRKMPWPATATSPDRPSRLDATQQAALDQIAGHLQQGDELICIVRPGQDPQGRGRLIMHDHVSPELVERLASGARDRGMGELLPTQLGVPRKAASTQPFVRQPFRPAQPLTGIGVQPHTGIGVQPHTGIGVQPLTGIGVQPHTGVGVQGDAEIGIWRASRTDSPRRRW